VLAPAAELAAKPVAGGVANVACIAQCTAVHVSCFAGSDTVLPVLYCTALRCGVLCCA
jgi:hypothetical protein